MSTLAATLNINPALWLLLKLNLRGSLRKLLRNLLTVHGAIVAVIVVGYVAFAAIYRDEFLPDFRGIGIQYGAIALAVAFLTSVANGLSGRGIYFTNPEAHFILNAPVTRQAILTYHGLKQLQAAIILPAIPALIIAPEAFFHVYVRVFVSILSLHALQFAVASVCQWLPPKIVKILHKIVGATLVAILIAAALGALLATFWNRKEAVLGFLNSNTLHSALFPFYWANALLFQQGIIATLLWAGVTGGFGASCFLLALRHLEVRSDQFSEIREELTQKVERLKKHGFTLPRVRTFEFNVPTLPNMEGAGPILWRRCQELSRHLPYLLSLFILGAVYHAWITSIILQKTVASGKANFGHADLNYLSQIVIMLVAFFTASFDFKSDTQRLEWLKSLPISPSRVVIGQLTVSSLYIAGFISLLVLMNHGILTHYLPQKHISNSYFAYLALSLPLGIFYSCTANALFLLVPTYGAERRIAIGIFQSICGFALAMGMLGVFALVGIVCAAAAKYFGNSEAVFFSLSVASFTVLAALSFRLAVWAYERFDVSRVSR